MSERVYGWKPSLPDHRDHIADTASMPVLAEVDPRSDMSEPWDQGQLGSCTAHAVSAAIQYDAHLNGQTIMPSRLDVYWNERHIEKQPAFADTGAFGHDGFKYAQKTGVIPESAWPYDVSKFALTPPANHDRHKIGSYKSVARSVLAFQRVLSNKQTIAIGFSVYESFESAEVAKTGVMPMPGAKEKLLGGHEVLIIGYLKSHPGYWLVRNSWGTEWSPALGGYFLMPHAITLESGLSDDFRTIHRPQS